MRERNEQTNRNVRRTALSLAVIAIAFYAGFILIGVIRS